jgi:uncharacterized protein (TIGR03382 family)
MTARVEIDVPCGATSEVHFTIGSNSNEGETLQQLQVTFEQATTCNPTDGGTNDGGTGDGGTGGTMYVIAIPERSAGGAAAPAGCGCGAGAGAPALLGLFLLALRSRRRRV